MLDLDNIKTRLSEATRKVGQDAHAALERLGCLEELDSLLPFRPDITFVRRTVGSANSNLVYLDCVISSLQMEIDYVKNELEQEKEVQVPDARD